jgi:hypothetical protein
MNLSIATSCPILVLSIASSIPSSTMTFRAKPSCPRHLVDVYERAVNALPASYLLPPTTGEVFASMLDCERRLHGYGLAEGFDVVALAEAPRRRLLLVGSVATTGRGRGTGASSRIVSNMMRRAPQLVGGYKRGPVRLQLVSPSKLEGCREERFRQ